MSTATQQPTSAALPEDESGEEIEIEQPGAPNASPQEFYAAMTQREDVRAILEELASA